MSAIGGKTSGAVTVSNAVAITSNHDQVTAALVTDDTKVTASTATVTINMMPQLQLLQLNEHNRRKDLRHSYVSNAVAITGNTDQVAAALVTTDTLVVANSAAVTITNASSVDQLNAIAAKTTGEVTGSVEDTASNLEDLTTRSGDDITITVNDTVN